MEEWKQVVIDGIGWNYEVSTKDGKIRNMKTGRLLKQSQDEDGYCLVNLCHKKSKTFRVHRLVAITFIPNPNNYDTVDHIDRNRQNNSVENLRWLPNENNSPNNLKCKRVKCVETGEIFDSAYDVERKTGLKHNGICQCCNGKQKTCGKKHWVFVEE